MIPAAALARGDNTLRIEFIAGDAPPDRSADFMYTLFVPARARQAVPCFDQPDLKGRWTVTLEQPAQWQNGAFRADRTAADSSDRIRRRRLPDRVRAP